MTPVSTLCAEARETARRLLTHYVKVQGLVISQMLRKSVETRDWLSTLEPRNVRAVMKRVVEDTTAIDVQVLPQAGQGAPRGLAGLGEQPSEDLDGSGQAVPASTALFLPSPGLWRCRPRFTCKEAEAQSHPGNQGRVGAEDRASLPTLTAPFAPLDWFYK